MATPELGLCARPGRQARALRVAAAGKLHHSFGPRGSPMAARPYIDLEMSFSETCGPFGKAGWPRLYCWLKSVHLPGSKIDDAMISVVARVRATVSWQEHSRRLTLEQTQAILESLDKLGIPEKAVQVEGVVDTSDGWSNICFQVKDGERNFALDIPMQSSGFDGNDAEELRQLFRQLFKCAGYPDYCPVIYGQ